jgi:hypothetical protein
MEWIMENVGDGNACEHVCTGLQEADAPAAYWVKMPCIGKNLVHKKPDGSCWNWYGEFLSSSFALPITLLSLRQGSLHVLHLPCTVHPVSIMAG